MGEDVKEFNLILVKLKKAHEYYEQNPECNKHNIWYQRLLDRLDELICKHYDYKTFTPEIASELFKGVF